MSKFVNLVLASLVIVEIAPSAGLAAPTIAGSALTAQQFEQQATMSAEQTENQGIKPTALENAVIHRLQSGLFVTDKSFMALISAWDSYETSASLKANGPGHPISYTQTLRVEKILLDFTYGRPALVAQILQNEANLFEVNNDYVNAVKQYDAALQLLTPLHISADEQRIGCLVGQGNMLYLEGDKKKAEDLFLEALSYDWPQLRDGQALQIMRNLYVQAGEGLIECRRHNLKALNDIYFFPATYGQLGPPLDEAIKEAGGTPPQRPEPPSN